VIGGGNGGFGGVGHGFSMPCLHGPFQAGFIALGAV
jgi:hypothetical protein